MLNVVLVFSFSLSTFLLLLFRVTCLALIKRHAELVGWGKKKEEEEEEEEVERATLAFQSTTTMGTRNDNCMYLRYICWF